MAWRFGARTPHKLMSGDRLAEKGWQPKISLSDGLESTYDWFLDHIESADLRV